MKRRERKGFTIVELVIVIAVIAILAAVLIPTFAGLVAKAQLSADQQAVTQMNIAIAADEALNGKPEIYEELSETLKENGFRVPNAPISSGYEFVWDKELNRVFLLRGGKAEYPEEAVKELEGVDGFADNRWFMLSHTVQESIDTAKIKLIRKFNDDNMVEIDNVLTLDKSSMTKYADSVDYYIITLEFTFDVTVNDTIKGTYTFSTDWNSKDYQNGIPYFYSLYLATIEEAAIYGGVDKFMEVDRGGVKFTFNYNDNEIYYGYNRREHNISEKDYMPYTCNVLWIVGYERMISGLTDDEIENASILIHTDSPKYIIKVYDNKDTMIGENSYDSVYGDTDNCVSFENEPTLSTKQELLETLHFNTNTFGCYKYVWRKVDKDDGGYLEQFYRILIEFEK